MATTVGQNQREMAKLAVDIMRANYRAADNAAKQFLKSGDAVMKRAAEKHLEAAERWRVRARSHGAKI